MLRELYMHGIIVKKGVDSSYPQVNSNTLAQASATTFYFSANFLHHPLGLPLGSLYDEMLKVREAEEEKGGVLVNELVGSGLDMETHFMRTALLFMHQLTSLAYGLHSLPASPSDAVKYVQSCVQINVGVSEGGADEGKELEEEGRRIVFSNQDQESPSPPSTPYLFYDSTLTPSSPESMFAKAMDRLSLSLTSTWAGAGSEARGWSGWEGGWNEERVRLAHLPYMHMKDKLPWIVEKKCEEEGDEGAAGLADIDATRDSIGDWRVNMAIFTWFAQYVVVILTQRPGVALLDIHASLMVLPLPSLRTLLQVLVDMKVVKKLHVGIAERFMHMDSAFDSGDIWDEQEEAGSTSASEHTSEESVYYELSFELSPGA